MLRIQMARTINNEYRVQVTVKFALARSGRYVELWDKFAADFFPDRLDNIALRHSPIAA